MKRRQPQPPRTIFALFVPLVDPSNAKQQAVAYIAEIAPQLRPQGVDIEVHQIRPCDLRNRRVLAALRNKDIKSLPALLAYGSAHVGLRAIRDFFEAPAAGPAPRRLASGGSAPARARPDPSDVGPGMQGEELADEEAAADLEEFYAGEMRVGRMGAEVDLSDMGE